MRFSTYLIRVDSRSFSGIRNTFKKKYTIFMDLSNFSVILKRNGIFFSLHIKITVTYLPGNTKAMMRRHIGLNSFSCPFQRQLG